MSSTRPPCSGRIASWPATTPPTTTPDNSVLAGSYGYSVPDAVQSVIGGDGKGGATATTPAAGAGTDNPFATGRAPVFTVTDSGATATVIRTAGGSTATSPPGNDASPTSTASSGSSSAGAVSATDAGLISAGVVAGLAGVLALYLGFCAWLYRRQVRAYRRHLAAVNRYSGASQGSFGGAAAAAAFGGRQHPHQYQHQHQRLSSHSSEMEQQAYGWPGSQAEPAWLAESSFLSGGLEPSHSSGSGSGGGGYGGGGGDREHSGEETGPESGDGSESTDGLLEGQEPSFFSVVMGPRRALRVVNGVE